MPKKGEQKQKNIFSPGRRKFVGSRTTASSSTSIYPTKRQPKVSKKRTGEKEGRQKLTTYDEKLTKVAESPTLPTETPILRKWTPTPRSLTPTPAQPPPSKPQHFQHPQIVQHLQQQDRQKGRYNYKIFNFESPKKLRILIAFQICIIPKSAVSTYTID